MLTYCDSRWNILCQFIVYEKAVMSHKVWVKDGMMQDMTSGSMSYVKRVHSVFQDCEEKWIIGGWNVMIICIGCIGPFASFW